MNFDLIELLVACGGFTAFAEGIRWLLGSGQRRINERAVVDDRAKQVQDMALDLIKPLHEELSRANHQVETLRRKANETIAELERVRLELNDVAAWAIAAKVLLDQSGIAYPTPPEVLRRVV